MRERHFLEDIDAEDLKKSVEIEVDPETLANDRHQYVGGHGDPDLGPHGVGGVAVERLDPEMLFDPLL